MGTRLFLLSLLNAILWLQLLSCAHDPMPNKPVPSDTAPLLRDKSEDFFRHRVKVSVPGQEAPIAFDGLMILVEGEEGIPSKRLIRLAGLGSMGLRLFSLLVDKDNLRVQYMHPSLSRIPGLEGHIARCVRVIWLDVLPRKGHESLWMSTESPWAGCIVFTHLSPEFTVTVRLLEHQRMEGEKP